MGGFRAASLGRRRLLCGSVAWRASLRATETLPKALDDADVPPFPPAAQETLVFHRPSATLYRLDALPEAVAASPELPLPSASSGLDLTWAPQKFTAKELPGLYASLIKSRLTGLVVLSGVAGYAMCPATLGLGTLAALSGGTALLSASANSLNQFLEIPYDSQMKRTLGRPLVRGKLTPLHALGVAGVCGTVGFGTLYGLVNPLSAFLGLGNLVLYAGVYTPMKRYSIACTWAGAAVGAIPPLMGWAGGLGSDATLLELGPGAATLAAILFAWQFPHFNSLSWNLRPDYSRAGYRVMCVTNPGLCLRTSLRYSVALIGLCSVAAPLCGLTTWTFAVDSLPFNLYLSWLSYKFFSAPDSKNSRELFRFTLLYLPAIMVLMIISKPFNSSEKPPKSTPASPPES